MAYRDKKFGQVFSELIKALLYLWYSLLVYQYIPWNKTFYIDMKKTILPYWMLQYIILYELLKKLIFYLYLRRNNLLI